MNYEMQRRIFKEATALGWQGVEPSVLGTHDADKALRDAAFFVATGFGTAVVEAAKDAEKAGK